MRFILGILILIHGLMHLMGYVKAFSISEALQISQSIPKNLGMLFFFTSFLFLIAAILFFTKFNLWFVFAIVGVITSQILIIHYWQDAKFGTIINSIIFFASLLAIVSWNYKISYEDDIDSAFAKLQQTPTIITQKDVETLPQVVQKYLNYVGVIDKEEVVNLSIKIQGEMRAKEQNWFPFTSEQFNFIEQPTRLFFMNANVKGLPTTGYHRYQDNKALMHIKLLSLITVVRNTSPELYVSETVTFFNDLCLFAPSALIAKNITWEEIDDVSVKAFFTSNGITISATLYFNEKGELINFVSEDRYDINEMKKLRFSTPVSGYKEFDGYMLPSYGEAIWHYPEGEFVYGKFHLLDIKYNSKPL